ncbi:Crp/Fnr family transcriptional regulator [Flavimaricola marinus]|uniref:Cyclic nucleotide-binding domain protein n=1 Tax=Flavimaricola marinus TaxID=1819565 RepID=A0A238LIA0_9RHOB|nr:cyclic nucleotide-binding domain-containing protein [Flavimaricola marinus]SMY08676.1 Cyclic nucleotide-binding domain protein [Flavimaricola marinus]
MSDVFTPNVLIVLAGLSFVSGYLVIDQRVLRVLLLIGSALYIGYYATVADGPLWAAIYTSLIMVAANLIGLSILLLQGVRWIIPPEYRALYAQFAHLQPGDFRSVVRTARRVTLRRDTQLTIEGQPVTEVYLVLSGRTRVSKGAEEFELPAGVFVGEVAYLLETPASASTVIEAGGEVLVWPIDVLRDRSARKPRFKLALEAMISRDLARKVALAVAPAHLRQRL